MSDREVFMSTGGAGGAGIIKTRYRDIDRAQQRRCLREKNRHSIGLNWDDMRGKEISIITPALPEELHGDFICGGPVYEVYGGAVNEEYAEACCPHIAEIGD